MVTGRTVYIGGTHYEYTLDSIKKHLKRENLLLRIEFQIGFRYNAGMTNLDWLEADCLLTPGVPPQHRAALGVDKATGLLGESRGLDEKLDNDWGGTIFLTPGLVNAHTHLEQYADTPVPLLPGETIADWILKIVGLNRQKTDEDKRQACMKSILEMIRTGTTYVNDITSTGVSLEALSQVGMRGMVSPEFFFPFQTETPDLSGVIALFRQLSERFGGHPLLKLGISPHSPYNATRQACEAVLSAIDPARIHTHIAETPEEMQWFADGTSPLDNVHETLLGKRFGPDPTYRRPLEQFTALLSHRWTLVHGVYLNDGELQQLTETGAGLVTCPRSNRLLTGETRTDLKRWIATGLHIGLGTDGRLSTSDLDLRAEARVARDANDLSARETFELLTAGSASAIGAGDEIGRLQPGCKADVVLWHSPHPMGDNPYETWLHPDTQPVLVLINGRIVLERVPEPTGV